MIKTKIQRTNLVKKWFFILFIFIALFGYFKISPIGGWDEMFYWSQLTSLWHDHDLLLHDDLLVGATVDREKYRALTQLTDEEGRLPNAFSIGTSLIDGSYAGPWVFWNKQTEEPRIEEGILRWIAIFAILKCCILIFLLLALSQRYAQSEHPGYLATLSLFIGTPIMFYSLNAYGMSHLNSAIFATLFVFLFLRWLMKPDFYLSLALGLSAGLLALSRWQNLIYVVLAVPPLIYRFCAYPDQRKALLKWTSVVAVSAAIVGSIQCIAWYKQFGSAILMPQGDSFMKWGSPALIEILFSGYHGLLTWSPIVALAIIGLVLGVMRTKGHMRWFMIGSVLTVALSIYVNACVTDWWAGSSYGARRFCALLPLFLLGVVEVMRRLRTHWRILIFVLVLGWMHFTATCYLNRIDDLTLPIAGHTSADFSKPPNDNYWIRDAQTAREVLADKLPDPQFSAVKLLGWEGSNTLDRIASILIIVSSMLIAYLLVLALRNNGKVFRCLVICGGVYVLLFLALLTTSPPVHKLNAVWKDYIAGLISSSEASSSGIPKEMCAYVKAMQHIQHDQFEKAKKCLQEVDQNKFPSMRMECLIPTNGHNSSFE